MVPLSFHSRRHGNSQVWLHVRCAEAAFRGARAPFDIADATVEIEPPPPALGTAMYPDDPPHGP
jgi:hypothetical protein